MHQFLTHHPISLHNETMITVYSEAQPVKLKPYRYPHSQKEKIELMI